VNYSLFYLPSAFIALLMSFFGIVIYTKASRNYYPIVIAVLVFLGTWLINPLRYLWVNIVN
jgi:hypothetical protein